MEDATTSCVKVAVHIRPLSADEILQGCQECVTVLPAEPQVQIGTHSFTFDHVYGSTGSPSSAMFKDCVSPLVDGLFQGYNATVLAYGQTGSGKTYTMGTGFKNGLQNGLIPQVMNALFGKIETFKDQCESQLLVSFIEIHKEEVLDLLDPTSKPECSNGIAVRAVVPGKAPIQIRESSNGVIRLAGSTKVRVNSLNEMAACLEQGSLNRATGSTNMNNQSSRSHAIFTVALEQIRKHHVLQSDILNGSSNEEYLCSKLHLVDLAGSERVKRTGSDGLRFKEGVHINKGLLALGNVIGALGDEKKRKRVFVPYRDSKLTRVLQDSLGGNSRTLMFACISPADINVEETLNTLKYANRTRNIQNKPVVNRDPVSSEVLKLRQQLEVLQAELSRGGRAWPNQVESLNERIASLEAKNEALSRELHLYRIRCAVVEDYDAATVQDDDRMAMTSQGLKKGLPDQDSTEIRMPEITGKLKEVDEEEKEWEHKLLQNSLDKELDELNRRIQQKEAEMKLFGGFDSGALKQHFGRKIMELVNEKTAMQQDRDRLLAEIESRSSITDPSQMLDQENQDDLLKQKEKSDEAAKQLQEEIQLIKGHKVQLQHKIKQEAEQYREGKASREKELLQLRKEGRRNEFERHKLQALNQRQNLVLQRKTKEAAVATKRLKELLDVKKSSRQDNAALTNENGSSMQGIDHLQRWLDHELEVMLHVREVRFENEKQREQAALAEELSNLKQANKYDYQWLIPIYGSNKLSRVSSMSPNARASRISSLESMLSISSNSLIKVASQLSEAEERERTFLSHGRWNHLRSLGDAKHLLQYMFVNLSDARCQLWERGMEIKEMKDQMKELLNQLSQNETQRQEVEKDFKLREQAVAVALPVSAPVNSPSWLRLVPDQKQLKYAPGVASISLKESAAFFNQTQKMIPAESLSMKKLAAARQQAGKSWRWKRSHHQWLMQFKWKWQKPWKLSEWIKHSDETIIRARPPRRQALTDNM